MQLSSSKSKTRNKKQNKIKQSAISAAQLAGQKAAQAAAGGDSDQGGAKYQGQLDVQPTYDQLQEAETKIDGLQRQVGTFEFHGYLRSGYGLNSEGGQQVAFQAPGAEAKYRLGNEAETYGEFIFVNNWLNPGEQSNDSWVKTEIMIEANTTNSMSYAAFPQTDIPGRRHCPSSGEPGAKAGVRANFHKKRPLQRFNAAYADSRHHH